MFKKLLKIMPWANKDTNEFITVQLNDKIMPLDRGDFYEEPLNEFLQKYGYGEVSGGGTMQSETGEIIFCDIEIMVYKNQSCEQIANGIIPFLEAKGVPKGSAVTIEESKEIPFGKAEGLAIYLDGINLADNVYNECDPDYVMQELSMLTGNSGNIQRYWQGETETAFYFYGKSYDKMKAAITEFVSSYPLCKGARVVQIA